jgi:1-phosphatidylinositol-4-phosphate 5-kinase
MLEGEHPFKAFAPGVFQELRSNEGIDDERFLKVLSPTANERLSEGASGAFMFFCGGGEFIVKTIRAREAKVLHQSLGMYHSYLKKHKNSLLCRFLGSYSLSMYAQTFYFVVMLNCFDPKADIQERFDIKGSWVGRSADPAKATKKVVCRHCNSYFVPAAKEQCTVIVGKHEANVVLKDNDLHTKISLAPFEAYRVLAILKKDSDLLGEMGVLDYSLLVGVKKKRFAVEVSDAELGLRRDDHADDVDDDDDGGGGVGAAAASRSGMAAISTFRAVSVTGPAIYYLGIVDFLQDWTTNKKIERNFKIYALRKDPDGLSVMHPETYKLRFQAKMEQIFDTEGPPAAMGRSWSSSNARALADLASAAAQEEGSGDVVINDRKQEDPEADADGTMNPLQQHDEKKR